MLFQLPPSLTLDLDLLEEFLQTLSLEYKNVIEFRHESWYTDEVYNLLRSYETIFCTVSSTKVPNTVVETVETCYFRFHGLIGGYRDSYSEEDLKDWAEAIKKTKANYLILYRKIKTSETRIKYKAARKMNVGCFCLIIWYIFPSPGRGRGIGSHGSP